MDKPTPDTEACAKTELIAALRAEKAAVELVNDWESMTDYPTQYIIGSGTYTMIDDVHTGGMKFSGCGMTVEYPCKPKVTWKKGGPPPRPPGPSKFDPEKARLLTSLENDLNTGGSVSGEMTQRATDLMESLLAKQRAGNA